MPKYKVYVEQIAYQIVQVEVETEEDARAEAEEKFDISSATLSWPSAISVEEVPV